MNEFDQYLIARAILPNAEITDEELEKASAGVQILIRLLKAGEVSVNLANVGQVLGKYKDVILATDPTEPPGERLEELAKPPTLPKSCELTPERVAQGDKAGWWIRNYVEWASGAANQTPLNFHLMAALWLGALPIGRRLYLKAWWGSGSNRIYPSNYFMGVAESTYYRKSTGLAIAEDWARRYLPHLVMTNPGSPEVMIDMMAGVLPANYEQLPEAHKARLSMGKRFAAARGLIMDEISSLFKNMKRDHMATIKEMFLKAYDSPKYLDTQTKSGGISIVERVALSLAGMTTPAELALSIGPEDWLNGLLTRFTIWTPEADYQEREQKFEFEPPELVKAWRELYRALPMPPDTANDETKEAVAALDGVDPIADEYVSDKYEWQVTISEDAQAAADAYQEALRDMCKPSGDLDNRLRPTYGRLHVHALKFAVIAAAYRWIDEGKPGKPNISLADWYFSQGIAEQLRAGTHNLLRELSITEEMQRETRVLRILRGLSTPISARDLGRKLTGLSSKKVMEVLQNLEKIGEIKRTQVTGGNGSIMEVWGVAERMTL